MIPSGFRVENVAYEVDMVVVTASGIAGAGACPLCGTPSSQIHSRYERHVSDLPCAGRGIRLWIVA